MYHNFLHLGRFGYSQENEMSFVQEKADMFFNVIPISGYSTIFEMISFLGWVGVPVFVFLTGYGLAIKYPIWVKIKTGKFLLSNYLKLFFLLLPALLFFATFDIIGCTWGNLAKRIIELSMLYNLDYPHLRVSPGVYWYFSLTFQLYVLYCFCRKWLKPTNLLTISLLSVMLLYLLAVTNTPVVMSIYRHCFPGWFPLFAIGIWSANNGNVVGWIISVCYSCSSAIVSYHIHEHECYILVICSYNESFVFSYIGTDVFELSICSEAL